MILFLFCCSAFFSIFFFVFNNKIIHFLHFVWQVNLIKNLFGKLTVKWKIIICHEYWLNFYGFFFGSFNDETTQKENVAFNQIQLILNCFKLHAIHSHDNMLKFMSSCFFKCIIRLYTNIYCASRMFVRIQTELFLLLFFFEYNDKIFATLNHFGFSFLCSLKIPNKIIILFCGM